MVIQTNMQALNTHRNLGMVATWQNRAAQRLSSGFRINSAADDAAGLAISQKMTAQIRGLNQAQRNASDAISLIQTAEGAIATINEMIIRMRELVIQAANDSNVHENSNLNLSDRVHIQREIDQIISEINEVADRTQFNTRVLLDGSYSRSGMVNHVAAVPSLKESHAISPVSTPVASADRTININTVAEGESGDGWHFIDSTLHITSNETFRIYGDGTLIRRRVFVEPGLEATIILDNINMRQTLEMPPPSPPPL